MPTPRKDSQPRRGDLTCSCASGSPPATTNACRMLARRPSASSTYSEEEI